MLSNKTLSDYLAANYLYNQNYYQYKIIKPYGDDQYNDSDKKSGTDATHLACAAAAAAVIAGS